MSRCIILSGSYASGAILFSHNYCNTHLVDKNVYQLADHFRPARLSLKEQDDEKQDNLKKAIDPIFQEIRWCSVPLIA